MNVVKTDIEGVLIIEPRLFRDARGYFFESFSEREFKEKVEPLVAYKVEFCQDNESMSSYGVMRGLHLPWISVRVRRHTVSMWLWN